ncbi:putative ATP-dependent RNA helicase DHX37 [Temnothorax americanus]|uniref:putative ATP-dependent RNA helicase DHX37 n=1 Tax=Temnothorax americanus TaxID=1964332 RepID=UPI0040694E09
MLCHLSEPLVDPPPRYNQGTGEDHLPRVWYIWKGRIGTTIDGYRASVDGVKWFAYLFLEGQQVYPKLKRFVPSLLTTPGSITKSWARLILRTQAIVQMLQS